MRLHDLLRFGPTHATETGVPADAAMQLSGNENLADKITALHAAAESQAPNQQAVVEDANITEAEKIAAAVDLAISLEDG